MSINLSEEHKTVNTKSVFKICLQVETCVMLRKPKNNHSNKKLTPFLTDLERKICVAWAGVKNVLRLYLNKPLLGKTSTLKHYHGLLAKHNNNKKGKKLHLMFLNSLKSSN